MEILSLASCWQHAKATRDSLFKYKLFFLPYFSEVIVNDTKCRDFDRTRLNNNNNNLTARSRKSSSAP
jgi:hypothetical protein